MGSEATFPLHHWKIRSVTHASGWRLINFTLSLSLKARNCSCARHSTYPRCWRERVNQHRHSISSIPLLLQLSFCYCLTSDKKLLANFSTWTSQSKQLARFPQLSNIDERVRVFRFQSVMFPPVPATRLITSRTKLLKQSRWSFLSETVVLQFVVSTPFYELNRDSLTSLEA